MFGKRPCPPPGRRSWDFFSPGICSLCWARCCRPGNCRQPFGFEVVGNYFLSLSAGVIAAIQVAPRIERRGSPAFMLVFACLLACAALLFLSMVPPPAPAVWRMLGLFVVGIATGTLNSALFHSISRNYQSDPGRHRK